MQHQRCLYQATLATDNGRGGTYIGLAELGKLSYIIAGLNLEHFWGWLLGSLEYFGNQSKYFGNKSKFFAMNQEDLQAKIHTVLQPIKSSQNPVN